MIASALHKRISSLITSKKTHKMSWFKTIASTENSTNDKNSFLLECLLFSKTKALERT